MNVADGKEGRNMSRSVAKRIEASSPGELADMLNVQGFMLQLQGLELKELRGALEAVGAHMPYHPMDDNASLDMSDVAIARASEVLARPKSSYEQEAELMEAVISAASDWPRKHDGLCKAKNVHWLCDCGKGALNVVLLDLSNFRAERRTP